MSAWRPLCLVVGIPRSLVTSFQFSLRPPGFGGAEAFAGQPSHLGNRKTPWKMDRENGEPAAGARPARPASGSGTAAVHKVAGVVVLRREVEHGRVSNKGREATAPAHAAGATG